MGVIFDKHALGTPSLHTAIPHRCISRMATDLPELRQHIAQYLDFATLKAFSLVCKAWYLDARPFLWGCFKGWVLQKCSASPEEYALWLDAIRKNAIWFRHIRDFGVHDTSCTRDLRYLAGSMPQPRLDHNAYFLKTFSGRGTVCRWEETLRPLIEQNRITLRQLELHSAENLSMTFLPSLLASLPHLKSLALTSNVMMTEDVLSILDGCPSSLERLCLNTSLERRSKHDQGDSVNNPDYSSIPSIRLKYLRLLRSAFKGSVEDILSRLAAHSLEDLWIDAAYPLRISPTVRDTLWRLTSLTMSEKEWGHERALPGILEAIQPHQLRQASVNRMNTECVAKLIEKQHQSLESLSVHFEEGHAGAFADILATCGRLKSLTVAAPPFVSIGTLIDPQKPWVCNELEVLEGRFGLSHPIEPQVPGPLASNQSGDVTTSRQIEEQFMRRLGQLTNLRCFGAK